jgi:hypothetical protein
LLLGQDWLEKNGFSLQIPSLGIKLKAYAETLVRIPTQEKGNRLVETQELQENVFCASSVVQCTDGSFLSLLINLNPEEKQLGYFPKTEELPKLSGEFQNIGEYGTSTRNHALQTLLRLAHIKEGEEDIRRIRNEYMDLFKLLGDKLTATSDIKHHIPTPSITTNRAITLRNYRIPEQHQEEVNNQVQQMLEDEVI